MLIMCGTLVLRKMWNKFKKFRDDLANYLPIYETCHTRNDCKMDLLSSVYRVDMIEVYKINSFNRIYKSAYSLLSMAPSSELRGRI